jgi:hypothetical protein
MVFLMQRNISLFLGLALIGSQLLTVLPANALPRRPIVVRNEIAQDPSFAQFAAKLQQAIRDRDAKYVTSVLPQTGVSIGYTRPTKIADLKLDNPQSDFWGILAYTTANGCARSTLANSSAWLCSSVAGDFERQYPVPKNGNWMDYMTPQVIVLGQNVNVRSQPNLNGTVVSTLSYEVVTVNPKVTPSFNRNPLVGWTPVTLNNGKTGYVNNRYAYFPLGYTLQVEKRQNQWQITQVLAGD